MPYKLSIDQQIENPLVKERNFALHVTLVDSQGNIVKNENRIYLELSIYTEDVPPLQIKTNTTGQPIIKGCSDNQLHNGVSVFPKVQIKEVTSHYRNGKVFIVIQPIKENYTSLAKKDMIFIDSSMIEPLIISNVVVKAKMPKQKK